MLWGFLLLLVVSVAAAVVVPYLRNQLAIDRCLDQGGAFNYELNKCVMEPPAVGSNNSFKVRSASLRPTPQATPDPRP